MGYIESPGHRTHLPGARGGKLAAPHPKLELLSLRDNDRIIPGFYGVGPSFGDLNELVPQLLPGDSPPAYVLHAVRELVQAKDVPGPSFVIPPLSVKLDGLNWRLFQHFNEPVDRCGKEARVLTEVREAIEGRLQGLSNDSAHS